MFKTKMDWKGLPMALRNWAFGILAAAGLAAAPAYAQKGNDVEFNVGDDSFAFPMPEGFCLPTGIEAQASQLLAQADSQNQTPVDIQKCGTYGEDYILIKYPSALPPLQMTREVFLSMVADQFKNQEQINAGAQQGADDLEEAFNDQVEIDEVKIVPAGIDEVCAYLSGRAVVSSPQGEPVTMLVGSCGSIVGQRHIFIHSYAAVGEGLSNDDLRARSKALMLTVQQQ